MVTIHYLSNSHSHVVVWLMEELGAPYDIVRHEREPNGRSPESLRAVHAAAKAPTIEDHGLAMIESTGVLLYLLEAYGEGRLRPPPKSAGAMQFYQWLTYMEGSAKSALIAAFRAPSDPADPARQAVVADVKRHFDLIEAALQGHDYIAADLFTAADIQLAFEEALAEALGLLEPYPNMQVHLARMRARPAYQRADEKGGALGFVQRFGTRR